MATSSAGKALAVFHYAAPAVTIAYFLVAKIVSACFLVQPSKRAGNAARRYATCGLLGLVVLTALAQLAGYINQSFHQQDWSTSQHCMVYVLVTILAYGSFAIGLVETKKPKMHVYLGTYLVGFVAEVICTALQAVVERPIDYLTMSRLALQVVRALLLLILCVTGAVFGLRDRARCREQDDETEPLLANGGDGMNAANGHPKKPSDRQSYGTQSNDEHTDEDEIDLDFDSDSDEPDKDQELKKQRLKRLQDSGSWLAYLKDFKIFIPILWPSRRPFLQFCLAVVALVVLADRFLNVLIPRQLGIITDELAAGAGKGVLPLESCRDMDAVRLAQLLCWFAAREVFCRVAGAAVEL